MPPPESARTSDLAAQLARELREREPGRLDMVGGGVRPGVAGPEHEGQRLPVAVCAVVGPGGHGVMAEGLLPGRTGLFLLRVRDHDGRVQVDDDRAAVAAGRGISGQRPGPLPGSGPRGPDRRQRPRPARRQRLDQPGHHRVRCHRPGQGGLLAQHRDIGQAVPAQRQRRGQVRHDLARVVHRPRRPPRLQGGGQAPAQPGHPERFP